jgi:hypothetical protein
MFGRRTTQTQVTGGWTAAVLLPAALLVLLGAWVFLLPLAGPYFSLGIDTAAKWHFSRVHWLLSLLPGIALAAAGLLMMVRSRAAGWLAGLIAVAAGLWLVVGPTLHPVWSSQSFTMLPGGATKTAVRWIAAFYGPGALAIYLGAHAQGLLERRRVVATSAPVTNPPAARTSGDDVRGDAIDHPLASRPAS